MIHPFRTESDTRAVIEPQTFAGSVLLRHFEPFLLPDAFDTLIVYAPSILPQQVCNGPIAIPAIFRGIMDARLAKQHSKLVGALPITLCYPILPQNGANLSLTGAHPFTGLEVSPCSLRKYGLFQTQIRNDTLEPDVFFFQFFQTLELFRAHAAVLLMSTVIGLFRYGDPPACRGNAFALPYKDFYLTELEDHLFCCERFATHCVPSLNLPYTNFYGRPVFGGHVNFLQRFPHTGRNWK